MTTPLAFPALSPKVPLSARQSKAIAALVAGKTITGAASAAGVTRRTVYRWTCDPVFAAALVRERDGIFRAALDELRRVTTKAVKVADRMMNSGRPEETQLAAMRAVLALALRVNEQARQEERLVAIEERLGIG